MRLVVVNDCANVIHDVAPYFDKEINVSFINRSRGKWSKTFGLACKILKSKGDIYHCNYALQDAFLTSKLRHLDILHVHGSDIRWAINSKNYGWIVKSALRNAKVVLYATPDLEKKVKEYRPDAIYLPTPVDTNVFTVKTDYNYKTRALYFKQCYEDVVAFNTTISKIKEHFDLTIQDRNISYSKMPDFLKEFDVFVDRFSIPSYSKTCLEAMSCGLTTIDYRHYSSLDSLDERLAEIDFNKLKENRCGNRYFIECHHNAKTIANTLSKFYLNFGGC